MGVMSKPKICLIGCGTIGALHAKNLMPFADLFFNSRSRRSAHAFQKKFGGRGVLPDLDDVLHSVVDAVVIASPPEQHAKQIVAALRAGKAVLVEKPICTSPEEVAMVEGVLAEVENPLLMVAENYYYKPSLRYLKQMLACGVVGKVHSVLVKKRMAQKISGWKTGYGALLEGGIHFIALISDLFDAVPECVEAVFPKHTDGQPERESIVRLTYPDQVMAQLHYSWQTPSVTKGVFQHSYIEGDAGRFVFESNGIYVKHGKRWPVFPGLRDLMGYGAMTRDFISCLQDRTQMPYSNFVRAKRDLKIVFDAYRDLA